MVYVYYLILVARVGSGTAMTAIPISPDVQVCEAEAKRLHSAGFNETAYCVRGVLR